MALPKAAGGPALCTTSLAASLFEGGGDGGLAKDLIAMKVSELKVELEARGEGKTGNKAWLCRRLHAAIVRGHLDEERRKRHADLWGSDDSDMPE